MEDILNLTLDEYTSSLFLDSIMEAAKRIPASIYNDEQKRKDDPIVELAYKLYGENNG